MTHIDPEQHYRVTQVSKLVPGRPHVTTIWRWVLAGAGGRRLRSIKVGGRRFILGQDLLDFMAAESEPAECTPTRSPAARRRASERAACELEKLGV